MLVCALLVAALAVQPAVGDGKRKSTSAAAAAATAHKAKRAKQANVLATAKKVSGRATRSGTRSRAAQDPAPAPTAAADPAPGPPADQPPVPSGVAVDPIATAPPEDSAAGAPPTEMPAPPPETPVAPTAPGESNANPVARDPGALPDTARGEPVNGSVAAASPVGEQPAVGAVAVVAPGTTAPTANPSTEESSGTGIPVPPDEGTGSARPRNTGASRTGSNSADGSPPQASPTGTGGTGGSTLTATGPAISATAIEAPLAPQATEAITRVRPNGDSESSAPQPQRGDVAPFSAVASAGASDQSVAEVLADWAKYALAVLALLVLALGVNSILAAARTKRLERQRERLMEDIGLLQAALLPAVPARLGALLTTVAYRPADGPAAGGDFYDAFALPDGRVGLLLGDVSGHGRQALAKTTLVRFTVRAHLEAGLSPREAIAIAGRSLDGRLSDDFATVIAAIHDPVKGTLTYASAGHPPPIVVGPGRHQPVTVSSAPPIGVGFPTGQRQTVLPMPEGVSVMIYSDGLLEARIDGVPLGPQRLAAWLEELGPEATAKAILDRVVANADRVPDDLAAVLLHASPGATAPAARIEQLKLDVLDMDGPDLDGFLSAAGVSEVDRLIVGRRVSELLATTSGVVVEVRTGEHPMVSVAPIGDESGLVSRPTARAR